jgi:hypothetical protein
LSSPDTVETKWVRAKVGLSEFYIFFKQFPAFNVILRTTNAVIVAFKGNGPQTGFDTYYYSAKRSPDPALAVFVFASKLPTYSTT